MKKKIEGKWKETCEIKESRRDGRYIKKRIYM